MSGRCAFFFAALLAVMALCFSAPAMAQDTPDEYADEWTEARRGDRDWKQRATEQLTTGLTERVMGRPPTGPMIEAHNNILSAVDALWRETRNPCLAAALNQAHSQVNATGRLEVMAGAFDMLTSALGGAASGNDIRRFLGQRLFNQIKDKLQEQAMERFKHEMREAMKRGLPDYWSDSNNNNLCNVEYRGVWTPATERYEFLIAGDCNCNLVPCGPHLGGSARVRRWTVEGWGTIEPVIEQAPQGQKTIRWAVGRPHLSVTAECCGAGDQRNYRTSPDTGPGNAWVGFVRQPQTTRQPPPRPRTGTEPAPAPPATGTTSPPIRPRPPRIDVPAVPDRPMTQAELEALGERMSSTYERAQFANEEAVRRLDDLRDSGASADDIRQAEEDVEATEEIRRRARRALDAVLDKFNQQQSAVPPDPSSARFLALHNEARAEVGAPPLRWDRRLAANAAAYAGHLARIGRLVHSPREGRGIERENLSRGLIGWGPDQMMRNWIREKQNFVPGVYPNVSRTGRWEDVSHYTQIIWPTTTSVGCGMASGSGHQWLVCRYSPGGNKEGRPLLIQRRGGGPERGSRIHDPVR